MKLFETLAGESSDFFTLGDIEFKAAPLTLREWAEMQAAMPTGAEIGMETACQFFAEKLRRRVRGNKVDPIVITPEWVLDNVQFTQFQMLQYVLTHGKMPELSEKKVAG